MISRYVHVFGDQVTWHWTEEETDSKGFRLELIMVLSVEPSNVNRSVFVQRHSFQMMTKFNLTFNLPTPSVAFLFTHLTLFVLFVLIGHESLFLNEAAALNWRNWGHVSWLPLEIVCFFNSLVGIYTLRFKSLTLLGFTDWLHQNWLKGLFFSHQILVPLSMLWNCFETLPCGSKVENLQKAKLNKTWIIHPADLHQCPQYFYILEIAVAVFYTTKFRPIATNQNTEMSCVSWIWGNVPHSVCMSD